MKAEELIEARKIDVYSHQQNNNRDMLYKEDVFDIVKLARKEVIEKAYEWWENFYAPDGSIVPENIRILKDFRKAMED